MDQAGSNAKRVTIGPDQHRALLLPFAKNTCNV